MTNRELVMAIELKSMLLKAKVMYGDKLSDDKAKEINEVLNKIDYYIGEAITILGDSNESRF